ncbi:response regulator [bacterium]|jgi:two-component system, NtrC family, sensor kinase|nr:response regulator [bacterium]
MLSGLKPRILVVDDNASIHEDFQEILLPQVSPSVRKIETLSRAVFGTKRSEIKSHKLLHTDYEIDFAFQGEEGLEKVRSARSADRPYWLVFMDVRMPPGWDGIETLIRIWELEPALEAVICTAYSDYDWEEILAALGASDQYLVLKKPFESIEVRQAALALTTKWKLRKEAKERYESLQMSHREVESAYQNLLEEQELRREAQNQLIQAQKMEGVGMLAGGITHDFGNLLGILSAATDLLEIYSQNSVVPRDQLKKKIELMKSCIFQGDELVKCLLNLSRNSTDKVAKIDLRSSVESVVNLCRRTFSKRVKIKFEVPAQPFWVLGDSIQIRQVLMNLFLNSKEAMKEKGTICVEMELVKRDGDSRWKVSISDTGQGIPGEILPKIFDPFFTSKETGTGLGLSVSFQIISAHGGQIIARSEYGSGATFEIFLPIVHKRGENAKIQTGVKGDCGLEEGGKL